MSENVNKTAAFCSQRGIRVLFPDSQISLAIFVVLGALAVNSKLETNLSPPPQLIAQNVKVVAVHRLH